MLTQREHTLLIEGYDRPLDSSPVEVPVGWEQGHIEDVGGGNFCRVWWCEIENQELAYRVIYNVSQDNRVELTKFIQKGDSYHSLEPLATIEAAEQTDEAQATAALWLMKAISMLLLMGAREEAIAEILDAASPEIR